MEDGTAVQPKEVTLEEWMQYWLNEMYAPRAAESSVYGFKNIINRYIIPEMGNTKLQKLKPMIIQKYYNFLMNEKGLSPNTVHKHHDVLNAALNSAVKQEYLYRNPMSGVERPKKSIMKQTSIPPNNYKYYLIE